MSAAVVRVVVEGLNDKITLTDTTDTLVVLVKIMRFSFLRANRNRHHPTNLDRNHIVLILQAALDSQELLTIDDHSILFLRVGTNDPSPSK